MRTEEQAFDSWTSSRATLMSSRSAWYKGAPSMRLGD